MRLRDHDPEELCFYSKGTTDIEFKFPFGWGELWGIADRTDYDLTQHQNVSGEDMSYFDDEKKEKYVPYVVEPSLGADRVVLAFLCAAYDEEDLGDNDMRTVLRFHPALAPVIRHFRCPRSLTRAPRRYSQLFRRNTTVNLMTEVISERDTEDRMKSVHRSA